MSVLTFVPTMIDRMALLVGTEAFVIKAILSVLLVCVACGTCGSLVVGNRMAFFSDALAHCAFAGISLGLLSSLFFLGTSPNPVNEQLHTFMIPLVMVSFGVFVGIAMVVVRERTALANDTVIGVFFAGAIGTGAMLLTALSKVSRNFDPEQFLFGSPLFVDDADLLLLMFLMIGTIIALFLSYNSLALTSFHPSLARSRNIPVNFCNYLFVILLAFVVNLSIRAVGVLLINAMLIVPAAAAANLARDMRQLFWATMAISIGCGLIGLALSFHMRLPLGQGEPLEFGPAGLIVCLSVLVFFVTMPIKSIIASRH
jgi:zinc transport system permease protein